MWSNIFMASAEKIQLSRFPPCYCPRKYDIDFLSLFLMILGSSEVSQFEHAHHTVQEGRWRDDNWKSEEKSILHSAWFSFTAEDTFLWEGQCK